MMNLDILQAHVENLNRLLQDREPGLISWSLNLKYELESIAELIKPQQTPLETVLKELEKLEKLTYVDNLGNAHITTEMAKRMLISLAEDYDKIEK